MDLSALLTGGIGIVNSLVQSNAQAQARRRALKILKQIMHEQRQDFATAKSRLDSGRLNYMNDPNRAAMLGNANQMLEKKGPYDAAYVSTAQAGAADAAARDAALGMSQLRERLQRNGVAGSGVALAAEQGARNNYSSASLANRSKIAMDATGQQEKFHRDALAQYQGIVSGDLDKQYGFDQDMANLYGSKQYGNSALLSGIQ